MVVKLDKPIQEGEDNVTHVSLMPTVIENLVKLNMSMFYFSSIFWTIVISMEQVSVIPM